MPYIKKEKRTKDLKPETPGELNYAITRLIVDYLGTNPDYRRYNDAIGAVECAKLEMYRRLLAVYENYASVRNKDIEGFRELNDAAADKQ